MVTKKSITVKIFYILRKQQLIYDKWNSLILMIRSKNKYYLAHNVPLFSILILDNACLHFYIYIYNIIYTL